MNSAAPSAPGSLHYPPGFRAKRGLNWGFLGLLYTSFYMCRYNLSIANKSISQEFAFTRADMGTIITTALLAYAFGQIINGLLTDRMGGKRAMFIGAVGTIIMNILFGAASMWGSFVPATAHGVTGFYEKNPAAVEFVGESFNDVPSLAKKLANPTNAISEYVKSRLTDGTLQMVQRTNWNKVAIAEAQMALTVDFNRIIHAGTLYDTNRFQGIKLSRGASMLLSEATEGPSLVRLNRVLLDEAYPLEIERSNRWLVQLPFTRVGLFLGLLSLFVVIRGIDGYLQAFGAPGMIKINTAWFSQRERGRFAGIFGFMINLGRFGIFTLGPALLAGFAFLGLWHVPPLHWRWLFWVPSMICAVVALGMVFTVKETPEIAGFHNTHAAEHDPAGADVRVRVSQILLTIARNPTIWIVALAYACTGAVRQAVDQWFPRYMQELYKMDLNSHQFQWLGFLIPFVASAGSLASGYISDVLFKGHRAPVAAGLYFLETAIILLAAQFHSANTAILFLVLISLTANSTHSILGTAAAMDIGGRKMAGFASGVIDSFQYFGGSLAGYLLGMLLDKSLGNYFYFMAPFGVVGGLLMLFMQGRITAKARQLESPGSATATT